MWAGCSCWLGNALCSSFSRCSQCSGLPVQPSLPMQCRTRRAAQELCQAFNCLSIWNSLPSRKGLPVDRQGLDSNLNSAWSLPLDQRVVKVFWFNFYLLWNPRIFCVEYTFLFRFAKNNTEIEDRTELIPTLIHQTLLEQRYYASFENILLHGKSENQIWQQKSTSSLQVHRRFSEWLIFSPQF